ncbi:MAG: hypothetical protein ACO34E_03340, partial [Limisphaerales bacterium]
TSLASAGLGLPDAAPAGEHSADRLPEDSARAPVSRVNGGRTSAYRLTEAVDPKDKLRVPPADNRLCRAEMPVRDSAVLGRVLSPPRK